MTVHRKKHVVTTGGLAKFIQDGGAVHYELVGENPLVYELWCARASGRKQRVFVSGTGTVRQFKSATAVHEFHRKYFPDEMHLTLQISLPKPQTEK